MEGRKKSKRLANGQEMAKSFQCMLRPLNKTQEQTKGTLRTKAKTANC